jgi:hypothetical protein
VGVLYPPLHFPYAVDIIHQCPKLFYKEVADAFWIRFRTVYTVEPVRHRSHAIHTADEVLAVGAADPSTDVQLVTV